MEYSPKKRQNSGRDTYKARVSCLPQLGKLTIDPLRDVLNCDLPVSGGQVQLITGHNKGDFLIVRPLLSDLLETTLDAVERWS